MVSSLKSWGCHRLKKFQNRSEGIPLCLGSATAHSHLRPKPCTCPGSPGREITGVSLISNPQFVENAMHN